MHGTGIYKWSTGATLECKWRRDKPEGTCTYTPPLEDSKKSKKKKKEEKKAVVYVGDYCDGMLLAPDRPPIYTPPICIIDICFP